MISKFILVVVMVVYLQSSMAFPTDIKKYPEKCDDHISKCGDELNEFVRFICQPKFFFCESNITVHKSLTKEGMLDRCCNSFCTPRALRMFFPCDESLRKLYGDSWIKDAGKVIEDFHASIGPVIWHSFFKYIPAFWLFDAYINQEKAEPYFLFE